MGHGRFDILEGREIGVTVLVATPECLSLVGSERPAVTQTLGKIRVRREPPGDGHEIRIAGVDNLLRLRAVETARGDESAELVLADEGRRYRLPAFLQCGIAFDARIDDVKISEPIAIQTLGQPSECRVGVAVMNVAPLPLG